MTFNLIIFLTRGDLAREEKALLQRLNVRLVTGRLTSSALLELHLKPSDTEGFLCGPQGFEETATKVWAEAGLRVEDLSSESFAY